MTEIGNIYIAGKIIYNMEQQGEILKQLGFDLYGRYENIRKTIELNRKPGQKFTILDVGGQGNRMKDFLPYDDVRYMDPNVESNDPNFIKGDGTAMPFGDNSFDWLVSADVFEHIPFEKREKFLSENLRVAAQGVILAAPFYSKETVAAEETANKNWKILTGEDEYFWLKEHRINGLPDNRKIEAFLDAHGYKFGKIYNNNTKLWSFLISFQFFFNESRNGELREFNEFYNTKIYPFDNGKKSYRTYYIIGKNGAVAAPEKGGPGVSDALVSETLLMALGIILKNGRLNADAIKRLKSDVEAGAGLFGENSALKAALESEKKALEMKSAETNDRIYELKLKNEELEKNRVLLDEKEREISWKDREIAAGKEAIDAKAKELENRNGEIETRQAEIVAKNGEIRRKDEELGAKAKELELKDKEIELGIAEAARLAGEIRRKDEELGLKNREIEMRLAEIGEKSGEIGRKEAELDAKTKEIVLKNAEIASKNSEIGHKNSEIALRNNEISEIKKEISAKNARIFEIEKHLLEIGVELREKNREIARKTQEISDLKLDIREKADIIGKNKSLISEKNSELERKQRELDSALSEIASRNSVIADRENEISRKDQQLDAKSRELNARTFELNAAYNSVRWKTISVIADPYAAVKRMLLKSGVWPKKTGERYAKPLSKGLIAAKMGKIFNKKLVFKTELKPLVSIIIPVYNQWEYTYPCLKSIHEKTRDVAYEIIVADDNSTDETREIKKYAGNITVIRNEKNLGFLMNCNNAAKRARGKYLLFLNNDTVVKEKWLSSMTSLAEKDEKIGIVGSKLVYPDGKLQEAGGIVWKDASAWNYGRNQDGSLPEFNYVRETDYVSGASMLVRKELWEKTDGFDKRYIPAYCEDTDMAFEARRYGYKVIYQPASVVVHHEGRTCGTDETCGIKKYQVENKIKFLKKWKDTLEKEHFENGTNVLQAGERSRFKKTVVVVDHYVPEYDRDAGSRTVFQYIKLFTSIGMNVKFIGDNFNNKEPYTTAIEQMGVEVLYGPWHANNWEKWVAENSSFLDFFFLSRPHISLKYIDVIKRLTKAKVFYYGHDLHFIRERRRYEVSGDKEALRASEKWKKSEFGLIKKCDMVFYPSMVGVGIVKREEPKICVEQLPVMLFEGGSDVIYKPEERKGLLFVGGFAHGPNVDAMQWFCRDIFPKVRAAIPDIKLIIAGSNPPQEIQKLSSGDIVVTGYISDEELKQYYASCRIAVVPLRYGAGIKGKIIEAIYEGLPVITTSIGAEGISGKSLLVADDAAGLERLIIKSYGDMKLLRKISAVQRSDIMNVYSAEKMTAKFTEFFGIKKLEAGIL